MASALASLLSLRLPCILRPQRLPLRLASAPLAIHLSHPAPPSSRAATLRTCAADFEAPPETPPPAAADFTAWRPHWRALLQRLHAWGHFAGDPHISAEEVEVDPAAAKRAVLSFSRQRPDVLTALPAAKVIALVRAGLPDSAASERKARNAYKRLEASFLAWQPLAPGDGGPADLQDVMRMVLALEAVPAEEVAGDVWVEALATAAADILPDVRAAAEAPPPPDAPTLSEKAKNMQGLGKGGRGRVDGAEGRPGGRKPRADPQPWSRSRF